MKKILVWLFIVGFILSTLAESVQAVRVLPRFKKSGGSTAVSRGGAALASVRISGRLRPDRRGINIYFRDLNRATSVSYQLSYTSNGEARGIAGSIDVAGNYSLSREFLFGTCSAGVCRYDSGISNAVLIITSELKGGRRSIKKFRIRV